MATWAEEETSLAAAVTDELSDSVTYRTVTRGARNATTGKPADTTADTTVNAVRIRSRITITEAGKRVEVTNWQIEVADLAAADTNDRIVAGGQAHQIVAVAKSVGAKLWEITTERSAD